MKKYILLLSFICAALMATAQTSSIIANTIDARKGLLVPRLATFPAAKPGLLIMKTGADSGYWVCSVTGNSWQKIYPATGGSGTSYTIGNGLKQVGSLLRFADSFTTNTIINSNNFSVYFDGDGDKRFMTGRYGVTASRGLLTNATTATLTASGSNTSINGSVIVGESAVTLRARNSTLAIPGRQVVVNINTDSIKFTAETASGLQGYQMRANTNAGKYLLMGYDSTSGGMVGIRTLDTAGVYASKPFVANAIAAATLQDIPGVVDVQDVQNGGLRATNYINQNYHDSSYLTVRKANELYSSISSESGNRVVGQWYEFISAPAATTGGSNDLAVVGVGSGATAGIASSPAPNRPGILTLPTGTTTTGRCMVYNHSTMSMLLLGGGEFSNEYEVRHPTLYTGTEQYYTQFGLLSGTGADQTNAVYALYDNGGQTTGSTASANYQFVTASGGSRTITVTSVPVVSGTTTDFQRIRIDVTPAGDTARLYINGTLAATHTTNIPTSAAVTVAAQITKYGTGTTSRLIQIDYINWRYRFTTSR